MRLFKLVAFFPLLLPHTSAVSRSSHPTLNSLEIKPALISPRRSVGEKPDVDDSCRLRRPIMNSSTTASQAATADIGEAALLYPLPEKPTKRRDNPGPGPWPRNDHLLRTAAGLSPSLPPPVWVMRQAGRYLPEFRAIRAEHRFFEVCENPVLASEVTLQPVRRFHGLLDAAIIFSDILIIPKAMGQSLTMVPGRGPVFDWKLESPKDIEKLNLSPNVEETLGYVMDAIDLTRQRLQGAIPIIGFCGGPLTLFAYMVEGGGSPNWANAKKWLYRHPTAAHRVLKALTDTSADLLVAQHDAGAHYLQVFDTNAGFFAPPLYDEFGVPYMLRIAAEVKRQRPNALIAAFPKDRPSRAFRDSAYDVLGIGWSEDPWDMRRRFAGSHLVLQGNLDPAALYADTDTIRNRTLQMVHAFHSSKAPPLFRRRPPPIPRGHIANLGHGIEPGVSIDHLRAFLEAVKSSS